jgi:hypothetical protein
MRALALFLLCVCAAPAQPRSRYLGIQKFRGTLDFRLVQTGTEFGLNYNVAATARATFTLERTNSSTPTWSGRMSESSSSITYSGRQTTNGCTASINWNSAGPLQQGVSPENHDVRITMFAQDWNFFVARFYGPSTPVTVTTVCPNGTTTQSFTAQLAIPRDLPENSFPSSGTSLRITTRFTDPVRFSPLSAQEYTWDCTVNIEPFSDDLELQLSSDAYQKWRPSAKQDGDNSGDPLEVTATVVRSGSGEPAPQDVERFEWELIDTSKEPGIAINWPQSAKDTNFDMKFKPSGDHVPADEKAQKMIRLVRNEASDKAAIVPSDWGGWSTLRVKAILRDGRQLTGKLRGSNENDLRLPRRKSGSFVADVVKETWQLDKSDNTDDDPLEASQSSGNGDGLTLYEEYRGFYEDGTYTMGDPKKQEYFAVNKLDGTGEIALTIFQRLTGLRVIILQEDEYSPSRVVNANYSASPHRVDQHGVLYTKVDLGEGVGGQAFGGPGTPKSIQKIGVNPNIAPRTVPAPIVNYTVATIVHEGMHSVNVYHHGETDRTVTWASNNGVLQEDGVSITVLDESGNNLTSRIEARRRNAPRDFNLGTKGGQHSGADDCVLRYDIAETYIDEKDPKIRRYFGGYEAVGANLCSRKAGSGVNDNNRQPQSRYGDASVGDCKSQILVNDAINAPKR